MVNGCSQVVFGVNKLESLQAYLRQIHHIQNHALNLIDCGALDFEFIADVLVLRKLLFEDLGQALDVVDWGHEIVRQAGDEQFVETSQEFIVFEFLDFVYLRENDNRIIVLILTKVLGINDYVLIGLDNPVPMQTVII